MNKIIKPIQPVKLHPPVKQKPQQDKPKENPSKSADGCFYKKCFVN